MLLASLIIPLVTAAPSLPYLLPNRLKMQESTPQSDFHVDTIQRVSGRPVKVSLGVMSHCPDAVLCEAVWDKTIDLVGGMMDLNLLFIGSYVLSASLIVFLLTRIQAGLVGKVRSSLQARRIRMSGEYRRTLRREVLEHTLARRGQESDTLDRFMER